MRRQKEALLIIDMLQDFLRGPFAGPEGEENILQVKRVVDAARRRGIPIIFIADAHEENDREFDVLGPHSIEGTPGAEIVQELQPRPEEVIIKKRRYSAFFDTVLEEELRRLGVTRLLLCGCQTDCCVFLTAADGFFRDFSISLLADATAARTPEGHRSALERMEHVFGAEILSTEAFERLELNA